LELNHRIGKVRVEMVGGKMLWGEATCVETVCKRGKSCKGCDIEGKRRNFHKGKGVGRRGRSFFNLRNGPSDEEEASIQSPRTQPFSGARTKKTERPFQETEEMS